MFRFLLLPLTLLMSVAVSSQIPKIEPGVSRELARWRAANYSDVEYKLDIRLEKGAPLMTGTITVGVTLTDEGAANDLVIDWRTTPFANDKDKPFARVVNVNGAAAESNVADEHLIVAKSGIKKGRNEIVIGFASPIKSSGAAVTRYIDKEDGGEYIYTLFVPSDASMAFPVFDQPDLKARFELLLTTPDTWHVVTNDVQIGQSSDKTTGTATHFFYRTEPISSYVFAFAAGEFSVFRSDLPIATTDFAAYSPDDRYCGDLKCSRIFVRRSQESKFKQHEKEVFRLNREGVKFLEEYFDYKFPFPKYDLVLIPEFPFGGMEHAGATFLREASIIFPTEPTKNDFIARANLIFHEAAHQWFGDTVTMKWFDDLWLKEGFAEFMAYKTLEKVMPEYNAWKAFYERNKPLAYLTDSTKGTTPIYQEIPNLSAAKSAYGNIVYRKAPSFLKQAEFYIGEDKFQTAVRAFLKKHEFKNAEWTDLVSEFETSSERDLKDWANIWVKQRGLGKWQVVSRISPSSIGQDGSHYDLEQRNDFNRGVFWRQKTKILLIAPNNERISFDFSFDGMSVGFREGVPKRTFLNTSLYNQKRVPVYKQITRGDMWEGRENPIFVFPNYQDYGYGIFLLDPTSLEYVLKNIQTEKDDFLRSMMWGTLWDSVREGELNPRDYVELAIRNIGIEEDESTINAILGRVATAMNLYVDPSAELSGRLEKMLAERMANAKTPGQRITFYRAYLNLASTATARKNLRDILAGRSKLAVFQLRAKDKFDIVTRLLILGDTDAPRLLAQLEKTETTDDARRFAFAARAGIATEENKAKYFRDFLKNKDISESWIEAAFVPFNSPKHSELTLKYLETALAELPNLKRTRKILFVNGWLGAFIGGQKSEEALGIINKFLESNKSLDRDLRLKILENADVVERAVKIRQKWSK